MWTLLLATALAAPEATVTPTSDPIEVDGVLDEAAWQTAAPVTDFVQYTPTPGGRPEGTTAVRFLQDDDTLYVGIRVTGSKFPVRARLAAREDVNADDQIGIYIDPGGDAQTGYIFYTNPRGIQQDIQWIAGEWNLAWNTVYRSKGRVIDDGRGFELEIALPFRSIKYPKSPGAEQTWGLMITRKAPGEGVKYAWPVLSRNAAVWFAQAAPLKGVRPPPKPSGVEIIPGFAARVEAHRETTDDPLVWSDLDPWYDVFVPSLDLRAGITPTTAFIGTINPDFSQVESDVTPITLNARFAFRFQERRPFFTEGGGYFTDQHDTLYTRSIAEPLYGLKVAGREGKWSLGVVHALDRSPVASVHEDGTPGFDDDTIDRSWALNTLVRARRDLPRSGWFGITIADKRLVADDFRRDPDEAPIRSAHDSFGVDAVVPTGKGWAVDLRHALSLTSNDGQFLAGTNTGFGVRRGTGNGLGAGLAAGYVSPRHRQELGFLTQTGVFRSDAFVDWTLGGSDRITAWTPRVEATVIEQVNQESFRQVGAQSALTVDGVHTLTASGGFQQQNEGPQDGPTQGRIARVDGWYAELAYSGQAGQVLEISPRARASRIFDFTRLAPAQRYLTQLDVTLRPATPLRIDLIGRWTRVDPEADDPVDDVLVRGRVLLQFSQQWGLRLVSEYNRVTARNPRLRSSALVTWLLHPFTAVYVGYAEDTDLGPKPGTLNRAIFAKAQVMFRP